MARLLKTTNFKFFMQESVKTAGSFEPAVFLKLKNRMKNL